MRSATLALISFLLAGLLLGGLLLASAPVYAEEDIPSLLLGEMVDVALDAGEEAQFRLTIPEDGLYFVTVTDGEGTPFEVTLEDADGKVVLDGNLAELDSEPVDLEEGSYTLTVSSEEGGSVSLAWAGLIGSLSRDEEDPGTLYLGSAVLMESIGETRYGILEIPPLEEVRTVFVAAFPSDPPQIMWVTVASEDGEEVFASVDNEETPEELVMGVFWTDGGRFKVELSPNILDREAGALFLVLLGPPPDVYTVGDTIEDALPEGIEQWAYTLELDQFYDVVTVTLTWDDPEVDLDLTVVDDPMDPSVSQSSTGWEGTSEEVVLEPALPGRYLIRVDRIWADDLAREVTFTVEISGVPGEKLVDLTVDEPFEEEIEEESARYFRFEGEAGHLYRITAEGEEWMELDFGVGLHPQNLTLALPNYLLGGAAFRQSDFVAPVDGTYYIGLTNEGGAGSFRLLVEDLGPPPALSPNDVVRARVKEGESAYFTLPVEEPDRFLSVFLVGAEGDDLDLRLTLFDERGDEEISTGSNEPGAYEMVRVVQAPVGDYILTVIPYEVQEAAEFTLITRLEDPVELTQASLEITNEGDFAICQVTATPADIEDEPLELLEEPLEPGEAITVTLPAGHYDLAEYDCEENLVDALEDVTLQGPMILTLP